jgi:hypothetical protein
MRLVALVVVALVVSPAVASVRFVKAATSSFDRYTADPPAAQRAWMRAHYWRMRTYAPWFDARLAWFPDAWVYRDLYAIYSGSPAAAAHPDWILRDARGTRLYIPYGCAHGTCPQYAADVGNPDFRADWIAAARATLGSGYAGLFVDDVNMDLSRVGDGDGRPVAPRDPRTGTTMTNADWRRYMAGFTEEIRRAFPQREIVHNPLWFFGHDDPFIRRELASADYVNVERGVNDDGIRGGDGTYGIERFLGWVDAVHAQGKAIVWDTGARTDDAREYGLAAYLLLDTGRDAVCNDPGGTPDDWWGGYDVALGAPTGARYAWRGLVRRDFAHGVVLLNPPGGSAQTATLDGRYSDLAGRARSSVTLPPASGRVLRTGPEAPPLLAEASR